MVEKGHCPAGWSLTLTAPDIKETMTHYVAIYMCLAWHACVDGRVVKLDCHV